MSVSIGERGERKKNQTTAAKSGAPTMKNTAGSGYGQAR